MNTPTMEERLACREHPAGRPAGHMRWEKLLFLHWAWDAAAVQRMLPAGLFIDTFEEQAWVGVVPFFMQRVHPAGLPCVPWLSDFLELNVRTYVHDERGLPGVWFFSLVCNQPVAVELARRLFHLNYVHARMCAEMREGMVDYVSRRDNEEARFRYGPEKTMKEASLGSLEFFLLERYVLFSADKKGGLHAGRVHHAPYRAGKSRVETESFMPAVQDGLVAPGRAADHALFCPEVDVAVWPIRRLK